MLGDSALKPENSELAIQLVDLLRNIFNLQVPNTDLDNLSHGIK